MIKSLFKIIILLIVFLVGCVKPKDEVEVIRKISLFETTISPSIFIDSNEFLDIPYSEKQLSDPTTEFTDKEKAKLKAILYRFYSQINIEDGFYKIAVKNASDINVSDKIFGLLVNNINEVNEFIKDKKTKGIEVEVPLITSEYLDFLSR